MFILYMFISNADQTANKIKPTTAILYDFTFLQTVRV